MLDGMTILARSDALAGSDQQEVTGLSWSFTQSFLGLLLGFLYNVCLSLDERSARWKKFNVRPMLVSFLTTWNSLLSSEGKPWTNVEHFHCTVKIFFFYKKKKTFDGDCRTVSQLKTDWDTSPVRTVVVQGVKAEQMQMRSFSPPLSLGCRFVWGNGKHSYWHLSG